MVSCKAPEVRTRTTEASIVVGGLTLIMNQGSSSTKSFNARMRSCSDARPTTSLPIRGERRRKQAKVRLPQHCTQNRNTWCQAPCAIQNGTTQKFYHQISQLRLPICEHSRGVNYKFMAVVSSSAGCSKTV